ncbi:MULTISPECIES: NADPH-dependent FMN reductase [unclassified Lentimonas]|uniref:NADPH-dependent FMN reductase n=1 Tax=unclassified Lentimonas TaxID=2630993 RepID=UPI00132322A0|nr:MULTISPECIES: NAD(P)H-dependent oxidoreductase [unclassified Lentimonas]CAA6678041.1 Unannotated [Lentimonas sp. CC4]CAA6687015.1 Unannotated [Lentimonas sp. CC6]CAA6696741.1 Unannotated [Lentimonas sp. CC10]CAA6697317.1 Unannotated [Lentimonas sp. CC19]CAA7072262.1 Unannotated [Lentimonas sp. CC11]
MKKILILAASNSTSSINRALAISAGSLIEHSERTVLDLNDYEMPIYSPEREASTGVPAAAQRFVEQVEASDAIILSLAEHNGSYSAAFKNVLDWSTRHKKKLWSEKPMLLLSTSPGARGGATVMAAAQQTFPHLGAQIKASFSLPSFNDNFSESSGVTDPVLQSHFKAVVAQLTAAL